MINYHYPFYETAVFENFRDMTENVADQYPDRIAFAYKRQPSDPNPVNVTFRQARERIRALGTGLLAHGFREQPVALIGEGTYDWICAYFTLMSIGAVVVPVDKDLPVDKIKSILTCAACRHVLCGDCVSRKINALCGQLPLLETCLVMDSTGPADEAIVSPGGKSGRPKWQTLEAVAAEGQALLDADHTDYDNYTIDTDRLATIVFTSGTTGCGKGVMLSQKNIISNVTNAMCLFALTPKTISVLPPQHTYGSTIVFVGHYAQGLTLYLSSGLRYIAAEIKEQQPTHLVLVPLFLEKLQNRIWSAAASGGKAVLLQRMIRLSNTLRKVGIDVRRLLFRSVLEQLGGKLELVISGGAALKQDVIDTFEAIGITVLNGYGITECSPLVSCNRNRCQKKGSVGVPILHEELKIQNPDENGEGEICVRGPNVMLGYYNDPAATAQAFDAEGYFRTGDLGRLDDEGWLYITGRIKNLIILSNGKNVSPEEIEEAIAAVPGVREVVVYAGESRLNSQKEVIVAEIYPDAELLENRAVTDIQAYFNEAVRQVNSCNVSYKAVSLVKIRSEEFAKNASRKIQRFSIDKRID